MSETDIYTDFNYEALYMSHGDLLYYDLNLEPWELLSIMDHLKIDRTNWSKKDINAHGYKNYDEDGNSYQVGILEINACGYTREDFQHLSRLWQEAEYKWANSLHIIKTSDDR